MSSAAPPDDLAALSLADIARLAEAKKLPPVENWNPPHCGDSAMRIARDGIWYHEGRPIARPAMVRLFSTILRREPDGSHVLVTPVEKLTIEVEDAPFVAVEVKSEGEGKTRDLAFRLNQGEMVVAGPDHPLRLGAARAGAPGVRLSAPRPYLNVRGGLEALISRPVFYELAELAITEGAEPQGLWSGGVFFLLAVP